MRTVSGVAGGSLPSGTVTFVLTDVAGSTRLWEADPVAMGRALARHDEIIAKAVDRADGVLLKTRGEGDSTFAVFARATDAVAAAASIAEALAAEPWPERTPITARAAVHSGEAELRDGDYYGPAVNRCARLRAIAHGGQTLLSQAATELARGQLPDGVTLLDLGVHRLKDLLEPEHVFELRRPDAVEFPPLASLDALPHNLPVQLTSFVGREAEIEEVSQLVRRHRLVTLTGAAGCGKTRLALQVAAELLTDERDGVWFVDLAAVTDPALVLAAVATVFGIRPTGGLAPTPEQPRSLSDQLADHLRSKQLVVLLDNCEHLVSSCAVVAEVLLRAGDGLRVLTTSREALGVGAETAWRVPSLAMPDPGRLPPLEEVADCEAVRLFVERAAQRRPGFTLTPSSAPAVVQICQRLDGIPLAIELAAARIRMLTPEQVAARLDDRFALLTGGARAALERHQTLRAAVDWSYATLSEPERALLRRVSVFSGGFTLEAAEAVCSGGAVEPTDVLDVLGQLIDKSLLTMDPQREAARYRLLETIRQYGNEQLVAADEVADVRIRHRDYFLAFAEASTRRQWGPDQVAVMEDLNADAENVAQGVEWSLARGEPELALRLAAALDRFWSVYRPTQGSRLLEEALRQAPPEPTYVRARALGAAGILAGPTGDIRHARDHLSEALALYRRLGARRGIAWSLFGLISLAQAENRLDELPGLIQEATAIARETRHPTTLGWILNWTAQDAARRGDWAAQAEAAEEALEQFRSAGDGIGVGFALTQLAYAAQGRGDYSGSVPLLEEVRTLGLGATAYDPGAIALGHAALAAGEVDRARAIYEERLVAIAESGMRGGQVWMLINIGEACLAGGDLDAAAGAYTEALALRAGHMLYDEVTWVTIGAAKIAVARGEAESAARLLGAGQAQREPFGASVLPHFRASDERCAAAALDALGPEAFDAAWQSGRGLSPDEALALARRVLAR